MRKLILPFLALITCVLGACAGSSRTSSIAAHLTLDVASDISLFSGDNVDVTIYPYPGYVGVTGSSTAVLTGIDSNAPIVDGEYIGEGVAPGQTIFVRNAGSNAITIAHDRGSSVGNRMSCPDARDFLLAPGRGVQLMYDPNLNAWRVLVSDTYLSVSSTVPSRAIGTAFQNTSGRTILGSYTVRVSTGLTLTTGAAGRAELAIGPTSGSITTVCGRAGNSSTGTLTVGLGLNAFAEGQIQCFIPPGWWAKITTTNETGTPTYSLTAQLEQTF